MRHAMVDLARDAMEAGKPVAAICHGPQVLISANTLRGRTLTCWPSIAIDVKNAGNFNPVEITPATIQSGETPLSIDWDYLNASFTETFAAEGVEWEVNVPSDGLFGSYYSQAISKFAPHPAAARLWQEFLYSDEGQNLWLAGGARPVRADAMVEAGTIDQEKYDALPEVAGTPVIPTNEQTEKMAAYLADNWAKAVG